MDDHALPPAPQGGTRPRMPRRSVLTAALWGMGGAALASGTPALAAPAPARTAASAASVGGGDLAVELLDPTVDPVTYAAVTDVPVYTVGTRTVRFRASAPAALVVTNVGSTAVTGARGTLEAVMWNYDYDALASGLNYTLVSSTLPGVTFTSKGRAARSWTWTYAGTLAPGQSVSIPLTYEVGSSAGTLLGPAFSQYRYNLLLAASVVDPVTGDVKDVSEKVGYFPGTHNVVAEY